MSSGHRYGEREASWGNGGANAEKSIESLKKALMKPFQAVYDGTEATLYHFLEIEGNEEDSEVHVDFRFAEVAEALKTIFDYPERTENVCFIR